MRNRTDELDELYRRYAPGVFRRARRLMASDADAQDVVHDVFLSLFENPAQYAGRSALSTFLYSATTHACLSRIRNGKNRQRLLDAHTSSQADRDVPQGSADALFELHEALRGMPETLAQVAIYAWFDELSHSEIAALVGCSRRHVANLLERVTQWTRSREAFSC